MAIDPKKILLPERIQNDSGITWDPAAAGLPKGPKPSLVLPIHDAVEVDGYREQFSAKMAQATRVFDVSWDQRGGFIVSMLGYAEPAPPDIYRLLPNQHPNFPWMYATDVELVQPIGAMSRDSMQVAGMIAYVNGAPDSNNTFADFPGKARYKVTYKTLPYDVIANNNMPGASEFYRFVEPRPAYAIQALPVTSFQLKFADTGDPIGAATKLMPTQELQYIWYQVPGVPGAAIDNCIGAVNGAVFDQTVGAYKGRNCPSETMLMLAPHIERYRGATGRIMFDITYKFLYRSQGHNVYPRVKNNDVEFQRGKINQTGGLLYPNKDFRTLFDMP